MNQNQYNNLKDEEKNKVFVQVMDTFRYAEQLDEILKSFETILSITQLSQNIQLYHELMVKAKGLNWCKDFKSKIDAKLKQVDTTLIPSYRTQSVVVIGAGPGGLVTALESALLGARVTVIEKRTYLSRNNILHLWPITMRYLNALGAKIFYPKFGVGGMDHIGTKQIQRLLLKINLLLGVKFYFGHSFQELYKKTEESSEILTRCSPGIADLPCTLLVGADGVTSTIAKRYQFNRTKFSGSLCIGMTFNFKNTHTPEEIRLREFALASLYHPAYFKEIQEKYHVALENLVYYQGETHYFVMTIKKNSLIDRGVFKEIRNEISELVDYRNVKEEELVALARDIATFCGVPETNGIVFNHLNKPDVQLFDFSERTQSDEASKLVEIDCECKTPEIEPESDGKTFESETESECKTPESEKESDGKTSESETDCKTPESEPESDGKNSESETESNCKIPESEKEMEKPEGQKKSNVIVTLVGDALIEPFWPLGTGCNRAVISALDAAWIVHELATKKPIPEILKTRQGCYLKMKSALAETFVEPYKICLNPYTRYTTRRL